LRFSRIDIAFPVSDIKQICLPPLSWQEENPGRLIYSGSLPCIYERRGKLMKNRPFTV
jgi:hypothetical protein